MPSPSFSVVLIGRNEALSLPRLIASLKEFQQRGGEIVYVDTGSADGSADVARSLGCNVTEVGERFSVAFTEAMAKRVNDTFLVDGDETIVYPGDRLFDYSGARNFAAVLAANDMCAMPDCDEAYTMLNLDAVENVIQAGYEQLEYHFVFSHLPNGQPGIEFRHCKFYDRRKLRWVGIVHETLSGEARRVYLEPDIIKLEHWQAEQPHRARYLAGLALDCYMNQQNDRNSHYLGRELLGTGRYRSAIKELTRHVEMNRWAQERAHSMTFIGDAFAMLGEEDKAVAAYHKSFAMDGTRREPLIRLARHFWRKGDHQKVLCYTAALMEIPRNNFYGNQASHYTFEPHELMYWATWYLGQKERSKKHYDLAVAYDPTNERYLNDRQFYYPEKAEVKEPLPLVSILLPTLGRSDGLRRCLDSIDALDYPKERLQVLVDPDEIATVPVKVNRLGRKAAGDVFVFAANDMEFEPSSLKLAVEASKTHGLVAFNSGPVLPDQGNICEHFLIRRDVVEKLDGEIFSERFHHVGCDNLLWAKCEKMGEAFRCEEARVIHHHFTHGAEMDSVYERGWAHMEEDRAVLAEELTH